MNRRQLVNCLKGVGVYFYFVFMFFLIVSLFIMYTEAYYPYDILSRIDRDKFIFMFIFTVQLGSSIVLSFIANHLLELFITCVVLIIFYVSIFWESIVSGFLNWDVLPSFIDVFLILSPVVTHLLFGFGILRFRVWIGDLSNPNGLDQQIDSFGQE